MKPLVSRFTLNDLRKARSQCGCVPVLTCYDYTTARLMQEAGVPALLVGDSAANVILGHPSTLPVSFSFMVEITAAVRRGAPLAFLIADMPFGSYHRSVSQAVGNICKMVQRTGCDCVKLELTEAQAPIVKAATEAGVAVMAHIGLRPQTVGVMGGYRYQGRTAAEAAEIVALALRMQEAGAAAILLEAVPGEVADAVLDVTAVPVIGCGAGSRCHGSVIVTQDGLGMTASAPRFVPKLGEVGAAMKDAFAKWVADVTSGRYPGPEHRYEMLEGEKEKLAMNSPVEDRGQNINSGRSI
jgi:3-methyl-2-oxobutanoate hydroxymethyltransferase